MWCRSSSQNRNAVISILLLAYPCDRGRITTRGPCGAGVVPLAPVGHIWLLQPAGRAGREPGWSLLPNTLALATMPVLLAVREIYC